MCRLGVGWIGGGVYMSRVGKHTCNRKGYNKVDGY